MLGIRLTTCGSLAKMALPLKVCSPPITHAFEPVPSTPPVRCGKLSDPRLIFFLSQCSIKIYFCLLQSYFSYNPFFLSSSSETMVTYRKRLLPKWMSLLATSNPTVYNSLCLATSQNQSNSSKKDKKQILEIESSGLNYSQSTQNKQNQNGSIFTVRAQALMPSQQTCRYRIVQGSVWFLFILPIQWQPMFLISRSVGTESAPKTSAVLPWTISFLKNMLHSLSSASAQPIPQKIASYYFPQM